mmetsp:Transcript_29311/g.54021  ORF Transcript_29311/g.54021 Transcript_29311/m.54021 type:complete len:200 (-) Transcript_29311:374-973(-)
MGIAVVANSVSKNNRGTTTCNHGPHVAMDVEDGQLERCAGLCIHIGNELLLRIGSTSERRWKLATLPQGLCQECCSLIKLGSAIKGHNLCVSHHHRIDLQICEVCLQEDVCVQIANESGHLLLLRGRDFLHQLIDNLLLVNGCLHINVQSESLSIHVSNIDATFVVEEHLIHVSVALNANVDLLFILVWGGRLNDEMCQ